MSPALSIFLVILLGSCLGDSEHHENMRDRHVDQHYKGGEHDPELDHEAVLGSKELEEEFDHMSPDDAKKKLGQLVKRMDWDVDGYVNKTELVDWISQSYRQLDATESQTSFEERDIDRDEHLTLDEYTQVVYQATAQEMEENRKKPEEAETIKSYDFDVKKFNAADENKDGRLDVEEYSEFYLPHHSEAVRDVEFQEVMNEYDLDKDGVISFKEFLYGDEHSQAEDMTETDKATFDIYDLNKNGKLESAEMKEWALPSIAKMAEEEAGHLISDSDKNNDGKLTEDEIVEKHELWVGSRAMHYGGHDPSEL